ncbi:MAG: enoyl-CoA hydratase/isomerase family protein [Planctomycetota bacterium]|jgi:methylglutaconyl-CoA hydratase
MPEFVHIDIHNQVATVTIRREELHNAFNEVLIDELTDAFRSLSRSNEARAIVMASEGKSFSAGADIHWMKRMVNFGYDENIRDANTMANMLRAIRECSQPSIARVHGATLGGGIGLVAACDMAVAVESAFFCLSEVKLGIAPAVISPYVTEKIGPGPMRRYALTAERFGAVEARRIGLISEVVPDVEGMDEWIAATCDHIKTVSPNAVAKCKPILSQVAGAHWDQVQAITTKGIAELRVSDEGQEGLHAFLEKRKPGWITKS